MHLQIKVSRRVGVATDEFLDEVLGAVEERFSLAGIALDPSDGSVRLIPVGAEDPEGEHLHHDVIGKVIAHLATRGLVAEEADAAIRELTHEPGSLRTFLSDLKKLVPEINVESILVLVRPGRTTATVSVGIDRPLPGTR